MALRISSKLYAKIVEAAVADHRSVNGWAVAVFEAAVAARKPEK